MIHTKPNCVKASVEQMRANNLHAISVECFASKDYRHEYKTQAATAVMLKFPAVMQLCVKDEVLCGHKVYRFLL